MITCSDAAGQKVFGVLAVGMAGLGRLARVCSNAGIVDISAPSLLVRSSMTPVSLSPCGFELCGG